MMGDQDDMQKRIEELEAQVKQLEAALRHIAEGTWWDGNEPWEFHRVESYALAALQENERLQAQVKKLEREVLWLESNWVNPTGE